VSKNLTKKQKTIIKDYFLDNLDRFLENDLGKHAVHTLVFMMKWDLEIFLLRNRRGADVDYCNSVISMFDRILDSDGLKQEEVSSE